MTPLSRTAGRPGTRRHLPVQIFLGFLVVYFLVPFWWVVVNSSKDAPGLFGGGNTLWFTGSIDYFGNLERLFTHDGGIYGRWILNSTLYALAGGIGATVLAVLAGYGFARYRFAGRRFAFSVMLGALMVPATALVIPTFIMFSGLGLTNTIWSVILPSLLNPFGVYLMHIYARDAVPGEILDAARVDGAGELRTFLQVAFPLMRPAVVTVLLLSAVASWNNYFLPLAMLSDNRLFPVTVGLGVWQGIASANNSGSTSLWSLIILGSLVSVIPLIIAFFTFQRHWRGGLSAGGLR
ncbi:carbohydrate ABC transporter permease [Sphaerisporangium rubeum]|uniref:Multiple sugar transport system permease protein n=1 Tax=Sphaerisporangium rubeum TaxID=321317 RepID=A0A7X0II04_9ACTN|nr:carbohydrate ABC transporter permease [Sphaerisporangium rubeum]MBB6474358.1 multiple sugar transport system permease protein [Sphaerisporangium rubeum]